jgi:twitching motility protein PilT
MKVAVELEEVLAEAVRLGASDVHLGCGDSPIFRLNGALSRAQFSPLSEAQLREWFTRIAPPGALEREEWDGAFELSVQARFRTNFFRHRGGIAVALRVVPSVVPCLDTLGLPSVIDEVARYERGLVLITGPTGSGKSTTMAAIVDQMNSTRSAHIITVEDPIEFVHESRHSLIRQRQVGRHADSFPRRDSGGRIARSRDDAASAHRR